MPAVMGNAIAAGPYRNKVQPPSTIIEAIRARPGMRVVEIGCGSGLYTIEVAKAIQPGGLVYAVDIQQGMLDRLQARMQQENVNNVVPILANAEGEIPLDDKIADAVFSVTVLPEIPSPVKALLQIKRIMKDDAVFADAELLMDPDYPMARTVTAWAQEAGLARTRRAGNWLRYVLVFRKAG